MDAVLMIACNEQNMLLRPRLILSRCFARR